MIGERNGLPGSSMGAAEDPSLLGGMEGQEVLPRPILDLD
jgi:hypothetical protein